MSPKWYLLPAQKGCLEIQTIFHVLHQCYGEHNIIFTLSIVSWLSPNKQAVLIEKKLPLPHALNERISVADARTAAPGREETPFLYCIIKHVAHHVVYSYV